MVLLPFYYWSLPVLFTNVLEHTPCSTGSDWHTSSLCCTVVRTGSEELNHPELRQAPPQAWINVLYNGSKRFGRVEPPRTHGKFTLWSLFPLELSGSRRFCRVEPPRTHVKLHHRFGSLCCAMVRTGSEEFNHPELKRNYPVILANHCLTEGTKPTG